MKTIILTILAGSFASMTWLATANAVMLTRSAQATPYLLAAPADAQTRGHLGARDATLQTVALHGHRAFRAGFKRKFRHHRRFNRHHGISRFRSFRFNRGFYRHRKFNRHHDFHHRFRGSRINRGFHNGTWH